MGCCGSILKAALDALPKEDYVLPSEEEEVQVIAVPGGNGVVYPQMSAKVTIPCKAEPMKLSLTVDMANVHAQIAAESTAGAGFRFVGWNYPVEGTHCLDMSQSSPLDVKKKSTFDMSPDSFGMMIFQQVDTPASPLETKALTSEMEVKLDLSKMSVTSDGQVLGGVASDGGEDDLYTKLKLLGDEGYSLSAVIDDPSTKNSIWSSKSPVTLVGQRVAGAAPRATTYSVQDVPIEISGIPNDIPNDQDFNNRNDETPSCSHLIAKMPTLDAVLEEYFGKKKCKLAAVYNPRFIARTDKMQGLGKSACHLIFQPTDEPYAVLVVDVALLAKAPSIFDKGPSESIVEHASYLTVIENFVAKGWELAAVIDMPDLAVKGISGGQTSTVKLVFQARSSQPGLVHAPAVPVARPTAVAV